MEINRCNDIEKLKNFLCKIDKRLPVSLSSRVNINEYAIKVIERGIVLCVEHATGIIGAILFYANDFNNKQAYLTLIATLEEYENRGVGHCLMSAMEKVVKDKGLKTIHLDTDVSNKKAIEFYCKNGYHIDRVDEKVHMIKGLL